MPVLTECTEEWGDSLIINANPSVSLYKDCFYLPFVADDTWGLFNTSGSIIDDSVDYRDKIKDTNSQNIITYQNHDEILIDSPPFDYIYGGRIHFHYGHFIINTLPRFWNIREIFRPGMKIVCHGPGGPRDWFSLEFFCEAMAMLGLGLNDFVSFEAPTRIANITIPCTSLKEQVAAHRIYSDLCFLMGRGICGEEGGIDSKRPIYLSKSRLAGGVGAIVNEIVVEEKMAAAGLEIRYPETMGFRDQVTLFSTREIFLGTAGSFFHTSMFSPSPRRIIALNPAAQVNSNFIIVDKLVGNNATYLHDETIEVLPESPESTFLTRRHLHDPERVAEELLACI